MLGTQRILKYPHRVYPTQPDKYYVYALCKPTGEVFYIGKGKGDRVNQHFKPSNLQGNSPKIGVIKKYGNRVRREILAYFDTESAAYDFEEYLISYYGVRSEGGQLTNYAKTRYEYSKAFASEISAQGHKHRKNKYSEDQVVEAYRLYYEKSYLTSEIAEKTGIHAGYLPYLLKGDKRRDLYEKYIASGCVVNNRSEKEALKRRYLRITDDEILHYHGKHQRGEISIIQAARKLKVRGRWLSDVFNGRSRKHLGLSTDGRVTVPWKFRGIDLQEEIQTRLDSGMTNSQIIEDLGISKTHYHRQLRKLKMPKGD